MDFIYKISSDALDGPNDETWEWQEEIGNKILIEQAIEDRTDRAMLLAQAHHLLYLGEDLPLTEH